MTSLWNQYYRKFWKENSGLLPLQT